MAILQRRRRRRGLTGARGVAPSFRGRARSQTRLRRHSFVAVRFRTLSLLSQSFSNLGSISHSQHGPQDVRLSYLQSVGTLG